MAQILVADDDRETLGFISRVLERDGHDVATAADGEAALKLAETQQFDLVITDMNMPGMDGVELTRLLRLRAEPPKIIGISGEDIVNLQVTAMIGAEATLTKPFTMAQLSALVARMLAPGA